MENKPPYGNRKPSEKTFEELIYEIHINPYNEFLHKSDIMKLLKLVREATIEECKRINESIILSDVDLRTTETLMNKMKTDRIKEQ